ncbi:DUF554 domain-containing protein [Lacticaseibacillus daqingensis]|uniref:DUF554 domain-containing protein n=1 Tax=Lacticaseibacillus daqingensis TaxID=2486014 RepID=UPI000F77FFE7|nr:DUF554 domain-containing protein [Lacticaseibacillus daqingensis]
MWGTLFNTAMIIGGTAIGAAFKRGIGDKFHTILMQAMGLAVLVLGANTAIQAMPHSKYPVLFLASLALGAVIGQALDLEARFDGLMHRRHAQSQLASGLATAILLFCIGTLSIVGPMQAALNRDYTFLFTNGTLDFITAIVLASTFGLGIMLAAPVLFTWQGSIYLLTLLLRGTISSALITELSVVGGVLIFASGVNLLGLTKISTLNLLPALAVPPVFFILMHFF